MARAAAVTPSQGGGIVGAGFDRCQPGGDRGAQIGQVGDGGLVLAGGGAQCEQPLLHELRFAVDSRLRAVASRAKRLVGLVGGAFGGGRRLVEQPLGAVAGPFETPRGASESRLGARGAAKLADRFAQGFGQPLGVLQQGPAGREAILFPRVSRQRIELGQMVAQKIFLRHCWRRRGALLFLFGGPRSLPILPSLG